MSTSVDSTIELEIVDVARRASEAGRLLVRTSAVQRKEGLLSMATALQAAAGRIAEANASDLAAARAEGLTAPMQDRLRLDESAVMRLGAALREIADQPDPLGTISDEQVRPNGLKVARMTIPLGVVAMIYESRPNVTADAAALCFKSGNAVILRGGKEAIHSNRAIAVALRSGLEAAGLPTDAVQLIQTTDRSAIDVLLKQEDYIDLVIPRGGESLIRAVTEKSRIPVLQHYKGVCHLFVDKTADPKLAVAIAVNAKVQRPGVCNALETLLIHADAAPALLPPIAAALISEGVELRGCPRTLKIIGAGVTPATEADWDTEYLDLILSVRVVDSLDAAIDHIADHASNHTEAIVTGDDECAQRFVTAVQSSTVLVNASTRFADGGELGLGAEIGISTSKLHAYGPMGARELTTKKFVVFGSGHTRA
jgi:glutamate-5-semialdehyde dehydrogenase